MFFKHNNISMYYEKYGKNKKRTIMIFPGWGNNRETFYDIIGFLKDKYTIYIFDYPGFGNSPLINFDMDIYDYSSFFISFMKEFNIKNPTVIAHSFGGRIAITLAGYYKIHLSKIILMSSAGIKPTKSKKQLFKQRIYKLLKNISVIFPEKIKIYYLQLLINIFGSNDYKNLDSSLRKTFINVVNEDLTKYLYNIVSEVLILWGENDNETPITDAYIMNNLIKNSALITFPNSTHFFYLENAKCIKNILSSYLKN